MFGVNKKMNSQVKSSYGGGFVERVYDYMSVIGSYLRSENDS